MNKSKGLGDDIAKITKATGIDKMVKMISKTLGIDDCGCEERKEKLNKMFPRIKDVKPMNKTQKECFERTINEIDKNGGRINPTNRQELGMIYKDIFGSPATWSNCGSCNRKTLDNLKRAYAVSCDV
jgi:hypothetical protein